jgi:hypothetical protein
MINTQDRCWVDVTMFALNSAKTRVIAIHYGDRGTKPVYSDDGVNWNACNSGLSRDPGTTIGGANTQGVSINPATVYVYIVLKSGASTLQPCRDSQPGVAKKNAVSNGTAGVSFTSAKQLF